ncbi:NAD-dependent epimerase/dehydratase family protein [Pseudomonadota bacterium]
MAVVWITGAHGFIGRHLAFRLSGQGHRVYGLGHGVWPEIDASRWGIAGWLNADINASNLDSLAIKSGEPEWLFHLAGGSTVGGSFANPLEDFSRTVTTTAHLLDWLRTHASGCRVIAVSSAAVYGSQFSDNIPESAATSPYSPYGYHKLMMEQLCHAFNDNFGLKAVIVRLFSVYGPWLRKQLLWDLCSKIAAGADTIQLGGTGNERRDWTDVRDIVRLLELAATAADDQTTVINGGTGVSTTVREIAELVTSAWSTATPLKFSGDIRPGDPFSLVADGRHIRDLGFNWEISVKEGISSYVDWFREYRS